MSRAPSVITLARAGTTRVKSGCSLRSVSRVVKASGNETSLNLEPPVIRVPRSPVSALVEELELSELPDSSSARDRRARRKGVQRGLHRASAADSGVAGRRAVDRNWERQRDHRGGPVESPGGG